MLDIDRDRQRISLGLKQTQSDPVAAGARELLRERRRRGRVTKVVTFGAFVEILPGVEGLVHISELAQHHVENPREVVSQGDTVNVLILEVDAERRRLSLSLKRVDEGVEPLPRADGGESVHLTPNLNLSEDVFPAATDIDGGDATDEAEPTPTDTEGEEEVAPAAVAEVAVDDVVEEEIAVAPEADAVEAAEEAPEAVAEPELEDTPAPETDAAAETVEAAEVPEAAAEPELEDTPAPETDAEVEVEVEAEPTADAEAAAGDEPVAESSVDADADAASGDEPESESDQTA